jgi:hypothetical protein
MQNAGQTICASPCNLWLEACGPGAGELTFTYSGPLPAFGPPSDFGHTGKLKITAR